MSGASESGPGIGAKRIMMDDYGIEAQEFTSPIKKRVKNRDENLASFDITAVVASQSRRSP